MNGGGQGRDRKNPPRNRFAFQVSQRPTSVEPPSHAQLGGRVGEQDRLWGSIRLEIETLSSVYVGSGSFTLGEKSDLARQTVRRKNCPIIPGSSIKGSCRLIYEVLTSSQAPGFNQCDPAGALFGALGYRGRASFDDAVPTQPCKPKEIKLSVAYPPRRKVQGRRFYGAQPKEAVQPQQIPTLAIPSGTLLETYLRFRNVSPGEAGGLLRSLGIASIDPEEDGFTPKLGGGKYDPFGWVRFRVAGLLLREGRENTFALPRHRKEWASDPQVIEGFLRRVIRAFHPTPEGAQFLAKLTERMQAPTDERL